MKISTSKILKLGFICSLVVSNTLAQNILDLSKYAQSNSYSTARSIGFGNALGSIGGDFSTLSVNPAGIGIYRSSEVMISPGLRFSGSKSTYAGNTNSDNGTRFGFNNFGMVFTQTPSDKNYERSDWKSISFGVGLNRIADYSRVYNYSGQNYTSSASQYFENDAFNYPSSTTDDKGTPAYLGYQSYLLSNNFLTLVPYSNGINQMKSVRERGGNTEMTLSLGGNYQDKLMLGATLGFDFLNHKNDMTMYEETFTLNAYDSFDHFNYRESYQTSGAGVNLKLGAIYNFTDYFRMGLAFHTPTAYSLSETSNNNISVTSLVYGTNTVTSPENIYEYSFYSPFKTIISATTMLGEYGFMTADYEYVAYNTMRYRMSDLAVQNKMNSMVQNLYQPTSNFRLGTEIRLKAFRIRGGYGFYGSPFKNASYQSSRNDISFGLGLRMAHTFIDLGIINTSFTSNEQPYVLDGSVGYVQPPNANIKNNLTTAVLTFGWKL